MSGPVVSVVVPLYNKEKEVLRSISSVLSQTFQDFELIVINDGSTDKGPEVVRAFEDQRIRIFDQPNQGVSAARNKGIAEAKTDLIAFLDADDEWKPDFLETVSRLKSNFPACSVFATNYLFSQPDGSVRQTILRGIPRDFHEGILPDYFAIASRSDPPLCSSAVAVTKTAITSIGGFPVGITSGEDLLTWSRLAIRYKIAYSSFPKAVFYAPERMEDRPPRHPQIPDCVAAGLLDLLNDNALPSGARNGLSVYIGLWHRMRAVVFIKLNNGAAARREISFAIRSSGLTLRLILLLILSLLPSQLMADIFHALNKLRYALKNEKS
jgi:glycosyltransferase involved in cell wall biosynthesis